MSSTQPREGRFSRAEQALEEYFVLRAAGDGSALSFETFVARHTEIASELRELHGLCGEVDHALEHGQEAFAAQQAELQRMLASLGSTADFERRYAVEGEVGKGGMGAVYRVVDRKLDRPLAMKVILGQAEAPRSGKTPPLAPRQLARFLNEAKITGQLDHPGIVPVHEVGVDHAGRAYFTMKLVKGRTLGEVFQARAANDPEWSTARVLGVLQRVCEALAFAHDRGVVHRDLKPANVMVGDFGEVYVMDWGLARRLGERDEEAPAVAGVEKELAAQLTLTREGQLLGTPAYMSPEQARGELERIGPASDVYAIGALLYELLAGHPPYCTPGEQASGSVVVARILNGPPEKLFARAIPPELSAICEKAMAREVERRYASAQELASDLRAFVAGRTVRAFRTGAWVELLKWVQRNQGLAVANAATILALAAGVVTSLAYARRAAEKSADVQRETRRAEDKAEEARRLKDEAIVREEAATARADALWAIEGLKNFHTLDDDLEYARSQVSPTHVWWLEQAHEFVDGRPADPARGVRKKPGLADHRRLLAEIRNSARAPTEVELAADRTSHPRAKELEARRAELLWTTRMLGLEPWPGEAETEAALASVQLRSDANHLHYMAWNLVNPDHRRVGEEMRALCLAKLAVAKAGDNERAMFRDTLAWALLLTGKLDQAVAEERRAIEEAPPGKRAQFEGYLSRIESLAQPFRDGTARARREALAGEVEALEREVSMRRTYRFNDRESEWWNTHLGLLEQDLKELELRIVLAERSVSSPEAVRTWKAAMEAIVASPRYGSLRITPQIELVPLGPDPDSGLWEFAHLGTGEPASRGSNGKLILRPETGLVFVLLPSGRVPVEEGKKAIPMNEVLLDPFFLSKYEMTAAQWKRVSTGDPIWEENPLFPAHTVSWYDCVATLERAGTFLRLPTEAQWEFGCRAGTTTPWWTGGKEDSLRGAANIASDLKDRARGEARAIGTLPPNPFGLHDVHGNVWEWCSDPYVALSSVRLGDGELEATGTHSLYRFNRGGGFDSGAAEACSGFRVAYPAVNRGNSCGLRVARGVTP